MAEQPKQYVVDTSSLMLWARYFSPFDEKELLYKWLNQQFEAKKFILLPSVLDECRQAGKGVAVKKFDFLENEGLAQNKALSATQKQRNLLDNQWVSFDGKKLLLENINEEKERLGAWKECQEEYIESADCQMILYAMRNKDVGIITEETRAPNDDKAFKKIPVICELQNIDCCNVVEFMLERQVGLSIEITYEELKPTRTLTCSEDQAIWLAYLNPSLRKPLTLPEPSHLSKPLNRETSHLP